MELLIRLAEIDFLSVWQKADKKSNRQMQVAFNGKKFMNCTIWFQPKIGVVFSATKLNVGTS